MPTTVDLQEPLSFSLLLTVILIVLAVLPPVIWLILKLLKIKLPEKKQKPVQEEEAPIVMKPVRPIEVLKREYLLKIDAVESKYKEKQIDAREAHIQMSSIVREFVNDATGVNVRNFTLREIQKLNMPNLSKLISEFYSPEFAFGTEDIQIEDSFSNARQVIREWN